MPIDEQTWAIRGSIAVDGEVILAEFGNRATAEMALRQLAAAVYDNPHALTPLTQLRKDTGS